MRVPADLARQTVEGAMANATSKGERALNDLRPVRVFHPMLLSLIPLCGNYVYKENAGLLPVSALARPAAVLVCTAIALWIVFTAVRRDRYHGGLLASAVIVPLIVVWGVLEEAIRSVIPMFGDVSRGALYGILAAGAVALVAVVAYRNRSDRRALKKALTIAIGIVIASFVVATLVLAPVFGRRAAWLITGYSAATLAAVWAVWRFNGDRQLATRSLNWFAIILLVLYGAVLAVNRPEQPSASPPALRIPAAAKTIPLDQLPDIYLFALDGYARADVLRTAYAYNNLSFEQQMKAIGFQVAEQSTANYPQPVLSLTALLNANYLDTLLADSHAREEASMAHIFAYYHKNSVFDALRGLGYRIESFSPGLESLEPRGDDVVRREPKGALGEFEMVLLERTFAARVMQAYYYLRHQNPAYWRYSFRRGRILYAFDEIARLAKVPDATPRFVFASMLIPEPPYLFTRDGGRAQPYGPGSLGGDRNFRGRESEYRDAYLDQVYFTNEKLVETAKQIIDSSKRPTVIVILSGRGAPPALDLQPGSAKERFQNLLLIRFPGGESGVSSGWRDDLSLVNVFRVVLNQALNAQLQTLADKTYVANEEQPFLAEVALP